MTFDEAIPILNKMLDLYRVRWTLKAVPYEDIEQKIRLHVFKKWHLYNQSKDLRPWLARLIQHQLKNELRNEYYNYLPPCRRCPMFLGDDHCKIYKSPNKCSLYIKYKKTKQVKENMQFAISYETIPYDSPQPFSSDLTPIVQSIYDEIQGFDKKIFNMFFESGFSTTRIAQEVQVSGMAFSKSFEMVKVSLDRTKVVAQDILKDQKMIMGFTSF